MMGAVVLGMFAWTLAEYVIHRWAGHHRRFTGNAFGVEHIAHHSRGHYFSPWWKKVAAGGTVAAVLIPPAVFVAGSTGVFFVVGFVGGYVLYEIHHRMEHIHEGFGPYGRWARRHHFYHHFHDPAVNHGVSSPLWDLVFGTYVPSGRILVPRKLAMRWLVDPATGDVREHLVTRYQLR